MKKQVLFTKVESWSEGYTYTDYEEYCKDIDEVPSMDTYYDWLSAEEEMSVEMMNDMLYPLRNIKCVVTGTLGLWDGQKRLVPRVVDDVFSAIRRCMGSDSYLEKVTKYKRHIKVETSHHDGRNVFEVYLLTNKGAERVWDRGSCSVTNTENVMELPDLFI